MPENAAAVAALTVGDVNRRLDDLASATDSHQQVCYMTQCVTHEASCIPTLPWLPLFESSAACYVPCYMV